MKLKHKIVIEILLVMAAIAVFIYNFSMQREIAYIASIVAVCGNGKKQINQFQYV